jgi:hypothetical protein
MRPVLLAVDAEIIGVGFRLADPYGGDLDIIGDLVGLRIGWRISSDPVQPISGSRIFCVSGSYSRRQRCVFAVPDCMADLGGRKIRARIANSLILISEH